MINQDHGENHEHHTSSKTCKVCSSEYCHECHPSFFGICEKCAYKIMLVLVIFMVIISVRGVVRCILIIFRHSLLHEYDLYE